MTTGFPRAEDRLLDPGPMSMRPEINVRDISVGRNQDFPTQGVVVVIRTDRPRCAGSNGPYGHEKRRRTAGSARRDADSALLPPIPRTPRRSTTSTARIKKAPGLPVPGLGESEEIPAATYSPTPSPVQYHRRWGA